MFLFIAQKTLHDEDDDDWPDTNSRSISTFRTFSKSGGGGGSSSSSSTTTPTMAPSSLVVASTNGPSNGIVNNPTTTPSSAMPEHLKLPSRALNVHDVDDVDDEDNDSLYDLVADDEDYEFPVMEFKIDLHSVDRRFGFSVIGGLDEGFPPRIDEISAGSPADRTDLEVGDEILEVNGKSLENATHTEVISYIHQCIKSRTICLRVKRKMGNKLALDLAQHSNVQDAFVIAVEQQARERLEKLSALQKIKPVDMTKLSKQLSQESSSSSHEELNGLIEGSPIYVTSVPNLSLSTSNLLGEQNATSSLTEHDNNNTSSNDRAVSRGSLLRAKGQHPVAGSAPDLDLSSHVDYSATTTTHPNNGYALAFEQQQQPPSKTTDSSRHEEVELELQQDLSPTNLVADPEVPTANKMRVGGGATGQQQQPHHHHHGHHHHHSGLGGASPHREMAVDVPDSFRGSSKAPPRYPPPPKDVNQNRPSTPSDSRHRGSESLNSSMTSSSSRGGPPPVASKPLTHGGREDVMIATRVFTPSGRDSRNHHHQRSASSDVQETSLTIDVVGNSSQLPTPLPRTIHSPSRTNVMEPPSALADKAAAELKPTEDQLERMRKYQEDIRKRREEEERIHREQDFLRTSLRGSKKLQALEQSPTASLVSGFDNSAFLVDDDHHHDDDHDNVDVDQDEDDDDSSRPSRRRRPSPAPLKRIAGISELIAALQRVQAHLIATGRHEEGVALTKVDALFKDPDFQQALKIHNKVQQVCCFRTPATPLCTDAQGLTQEILSSLRSSRLAEASELSDLLNRYDVESLLLAHDAIAKREAVVAMSPDEELLDRASQYTDDSVKIVRIEKTNEPLGATVRNEGEAVIIGRIVKGGVAEKSGLLHEGDEILEVNNTEMRGKSVNDVCDILANMTGTLTFLVVPTQCEPTKLASHETVMHVKAHFDYDPEEDVYIPCRELGISFRKGDILHILNQADPNWWQAFREGEDDQSLAGLIPSKSFQQQRAAMEQKIVADSNNRNSDGRSAKKGNTLLLCAHKRNTKKSKTKLNKKGGGGGSGSAGTLMYNASYNVDSVDQLSVGGSVGEPDDNEILTYEEVALYYPRANRKRPIVLIGPPNIGRHELRQKLMEDVDRFAAAVPHTSRPKKDEELDGQDYYFISRQQFESDILGRRFVEHGEYEKNYYGTSLDAIRTVVNSGKICVLNLHPQSLKILKASDLKPFVVYVAPPLLDKLRQNRTKMGINAKDDELKEIIVKAREMDESYGHYFDLVIVNSDLERAYEQLLREINALEREPQWVPAVWLQDD